VSILNPLFEAVAWVLMRIHAVLAVPFGPSSGVTWLLSIVILVVLMRLAMVPLFIKQRNAMLKMQAHMPQLRELQKKFKNDKQRLNEETMKFYKENGINPLGGCLPLLAQLPVFWSLFNVLRAIATWKVGTTPLYGLTVSVVVSARHAHIFGVTLYDNFLRPVAGETMTQRIVILVFVLISAATTFLTMRQSQKRGMMNQTAPDPDQPGAAAAAAMSKNMMYIAPFFALTGLYWAFGLVLYWVTTNLWTLAQQHFLFRNLPVVGSATVGASAVQAASGTSAAAVKNRAPAKAVPAKTGTSAKAAPAKQVNSAKPGNAAKQVSSAKSVNGSGTTSASGTAAKTPAPATKPVKAKAQAPAGNRAEQSQDTVPQDTVPQDTVPQDTVPQDTVPQDTVPAQERAKSQETAKAAPAKAGTAKAATNGASSANGSGPVRGLLRFGKAKPEPEPEPVAPQTKVVRQQPVRQSRSRRSGNSGKR
jgi:YidC/Oxa1 family membrane protein insertase